MRVSNTDSWELATSLSPAKAWSTRYSVRSFMYRTATAEPDIPSDAEPPRDTGSICSSSLEPRCTDDGGSRSATVKVV